MINSVLASLFALGAPLLAWPLEVLLPYPALIEEPLKALIIFIGIDPRSTATSRMRLAAIVGVLFAFSESVLYLFSFLQFGVFFRFPQRLLYTIPLHVLTSLLIALPSPSWRRIVAFGIPPAMLIHFLYNHYLASP